VIPSSCGADDGNRTAYSARQSGQGSRLPIIVPTSASIASMAKKIGTTAGS
jgi:hypothetical protein